MTIFKKHKVYNKNMDKKIKQHEQYMNSEIAKIEGGAAREKAVKRLYEYHIATVRDFQHERLIHLIVTFFFAGLLLSSIVALFLLTLLPDMGDQSSLSVLIMAVSAILFVTEIFYIKYYYALENGIQKLYAFSKKLYEMI